MCPIINLNNTDYFGVINFFNLQNYFYNNCKKYIVFFIRTYEFKGLANCLSQLKHYNPNYRKIEYKNKELDYKHQLFYIDSLCSSIVSIIMFHAHCFPNSKQLDITSTCSTH